jgi:alpha-N-arabinofuranosidase
MANLRRQNGREKPWKVPYFGVGNESWGCGGNMRPEFYADNFKRYNTFVKDYPGNHILRIACGSNGSDYNWTEVLMNMASRNMGGLSLHFYTLPTGVWGSKKGSATQFGEDQWFSTLRQCLRMDDLVSRHSAIMDKVDSRKRVGLVVDEWGTWYDVEPGTNPGFLYQQNTLRDALAAGTTLNIFNNHCDRVKMANIAQMINVLQSMLLTDNEKMLLTPTYLVFELYTPHHDAKLIPSELQSLDYAFGSNKVASVNVSASRDSDGKIHVTLCNLNPNLLQEVNCELKGSTAKKISGRVVTASEMNAHNTFDQQEIVKTAAFNDFKPTESGFVTTLPSKSVVALEIE